MLRAVHGALDEGSGQAEIEIQGTQLTLKTGEWSAWVPLTFKYNVLASAHGMSQIHVIRADQELQLYASPVNLDPRNPPLPISKPDDFSARLANRSASTAPWAGPRPPGPSTRAAVDEATFLYDCDRAFDDREKLIFKGLESRRLGPRRRVSRRPTGSPT